MTWVWERALYGSLFLTIFGFAATGVDYSVLAIPSWLSSFLLLLLYYEARAKGATVFHALPLTALIMVWSYALAPVASVAWDQYLLLPPREIDWLTWTSRISWVYCACIIMFFIGVRFGARFDGAASQVWVINRRRFFFSAVFLLCVTAVLQLYIYAQFGGVLSYLTKWTEERESFEGMGSLFMVAEAFPIIFFIFAAVLIKEKGWKDARSLVWVLFIVFFLLKLFFGGFRGSRSNTIWGLFWAAGIVHLYIFELRARHFIIGFLFLISFMSAYSVYKSFGVHSFSGEYSISDTGRFTGNPVQEMLLGDFSRAGVNAYILAEYFSRADFELKYGSTYANTLGKLVPDGGLLDSLHSKNTAAADLFYGDRYAKAGEKSHNSRIFGLYGEGLLNFGPVLAVLLFGIVGALIAKVDLFFRSLSLGDARLLLLPFVTNACFMAILSDSDNFLFFTFKNGILPLILIWFSVQKLPQLQ